MRPPAFFDICLYGVLALAAVLFASGGFLFLDFRTLRWVGEYPVIHRLFVVFPIALAIFLWWVRSKCWPQGGQLALQRGGIRLAEEKPRLVLIVLAISYVLIMGMAAMWRHNVFETSFDMAVFDQALWNTLHGRLLYSSIKGGICILGDHMSPLLLLYVPLYAVWNNASVLLWAQALVAAASMLLIYRLARERLNDSVIALALALAYALYLPMRNALRFDFHPEIVSDFLWLLALWALWRGHLVAFVAACFAACLGKENMWGVCAAMGLYLFWPCRRRLLGLSFVVISVICFFLAVLVFIPAISGRPYLYAGNFGHVAEHWMDVFSLSTLAYLAKILLPLGMISFLSPPVMLLTLPVLAQNLLSKNPFMHFIFFQYSYGLTCFVFAAAIDGLARWQEGKTWLQKRVAEGLWKNVSTRSLAAWAMCWSLLMAGVGEGHILGVFWSQTKPVHHVLSETLNRIPSEDSVITHEFYAPHLTHRKTLVIRESREASSVNSYDMDWAVLDEARLGNNAQEILRGYLQAGFTPALQQEGIWVLRKK